MMNLGPFSAQSQRIWQDVGIDLNSYEVDFSLTSPAIDLSRNEQARGFVQRVKELTLYCGTRFAMTALYPIQSTLLSLMIKEYSAIWLDQFRKSSLERLVNKGHLVARVILEKNGIKHDALVVTTAAGLQSRKWILQVVGRTASIETSILDIARYYFKDANYSLFMINGPSVGRSKGQATLDSLADAQELGLCYLENRVKATHIAIVGHSFGGSLLSRVVCNHVFKPHIQYVVVRQMSFARLVDIAKIFTGSIWCGLILERLGMDIDAAESSNFLEEQGIHEYILQATKCSKQPIDQSDFITDQVIPAEATLGVALVQKKAWNHKTFIGLGPVGHADDEVWESTLRVVFEHWSA